MSTSIADHKLFTKVAAVLLALIAVVHALRVVYAVELIVDGMIVPVGLSLPVAVVIGALAWMVWRESRTP